jgi:N6-L-threonylcarbamoyladenine synthase
MNVCTVGIDTSCYASSVACVDGNGIVFQKKTMLSVDPGERGLRQSDAVFLHVRNLEPLVRELFLALSGKEIQNFCVSTQPTDEEGSYMPVFLAGLTAATAAASALGLPLMRTSHQRGHVRAALLGNEALLTRNSFLALHLSGGTTDVLEVCLCDRRIAGVRRIGGSEDLHIGQFVDRVGVRLGLPFPAGPSLEELAERAAARNIKIPAALHGLRCSFSGPETEAQRLIDGGAEPCELAYAVYDCMARTVNKLLSAANAKDVLLCGGVSGSALFLSLLAGRTNTRVFTAKPGLSGDNAVGVALIGKDMWGAAV